MCSCPCLKRVVGILGYTGICYDRFPNDQEHSRVPQFQTAIDLVPGLKRHTRNTKLQRTTSSGPT